jgi:hypothetical protein
LAPFADDRFQVSRGVCVIRANSQTSLSQSLFNENRIAEQALKHFPAKWVPLRVGAFVQPV